MNHEEIYHLRDKFLAAAVQGVLANPAVTQRNADGSVNVKAVINLANQVTNHLLDSRAGYYKYEDAQKGKPNEA